METSGEIADNYGCDWHQHQRETKNKPACAAKEYNELLLLFLIVVGVVMFTKATRKIPVQYAKRMVGRKAYGGQSTYIPVKVNTAGVIPVIFASSLLYNFHVFSLLSLL